jgi:phosphatidylglycerol:prolipoprotein diacylglycerol transferase
MRPILFTFNLPGARQLAVPAYGFMILLSFVLGTWLARRWAAARGVSPSDVGDLSLAAVFGALAGSRAAYVLDFWPEFAGRPWWHLLRFWEGGLVFYGGFLGATALIFALIYLRRLDWRQITDFMSPSVALGLGLTRIGCFLNGCCHGLPCAADHPLAVTFPRGSHCFANQVAAGLIPPDAAHSLPVYATQLVSSAFDFLLFAGLTWLLWKHGRRLPGAVFLTFLLAYPAFRFAVEFVRDEPRGAWGLSAGQQMSLALLVPAAGAGLIWLAWAALSARQARANLQGGMASARLCKVRTAQLPVGWGASLRSEGAPASSAGPR